MIERTRFGALVCLILVLGGCALNDRRIDPVDYARAYPESLDRVTTLDVQVIRRPQSIELTNATARAFGPSTLWLNAAFSRPIDGLAVGETLTIPLGEFRNEFSERFRAGGFFATVDPTKLVLAELETDDGALYGLIVVENVLE
ncbi:MAG: hypothetical protein RIB58_04320 [Phycisphaerales bacterium]